jgi:hypothetical protein
MRSLLLALALCAAATAQAQDGLLAPAPGAAPVAATSEPPPRALTNELHTELGVLTGGYSHTGGLHGDAFLVNGTGGHYLFGGLTGEVTLLSLMPLRGGGPGTSSSLGLRLGYTGERWSVVAGPVFQATYPASPILQVLPSARGLYRLGVVTLDAGLLDRNGMVPAHAGVSYGHVGLAYVLPLGARAHARIPLSPRVGVQVEGFAFRAGNAHSAMLTVGLVGNPPSSRTGAPP